MIMTLLVRYAAGRFLQRVVATLPWQIWAALAVVVFLGASGWYINRTAYNRGYDEANTLWQEATDIETLRQAEANASALVFAQEEVARLRAAKEVADAHIERLLEEAASDPDADRRAIGSDSVRRLNSGR